MNIFCIVSASESDDNHFLILFRVGHLRTKDKLQKTPEPLADGKQVAEIEETVLSVERQQQIAVVNAAVDGSYNVWSWLYQ